MTNLKEIIKQSKKKEPKAWAKFDKRWDSKMMQPVMDFIRELNDHINPKARNAIKGNDWLYNGPDIEGKVWNLLEKVRRITLRERN